MKVKDGRIVTVAIVFISALVLLTMVASVTALDCDCDLCVNETGWWGAGGAFNASGTPIQAAVDNATAGETICVQNGTYSENVVVNKSLTIRSEYGASSTTVEANDTTLAVFHVINDSVNISGFTIKNATDAQGILCDDADNCTISENTISNNVAGIHLDKGSVNNLVNNTVLNNIYGIYLDSSSYNNLTGNTATNNNYTGIFLDSSSNNTITGNIVNSNPGGGIYLDSSSGNNLTGNTATNNDNGIWLYNSSYNNLTNNNASGNDDGIKLEYSSNNNTLTGNNASNNYVVGIKLEYWSNNNTLTSKTANSNVGLGMDGIGIHLFDSNHSNLTGKYVFSSNSNHLIFPSFIPLRKSVFYRKLLYYDRNILSRGEWTKTRSSGNYKRGLLNLTVRMSCFGHVYGNSKPNWPPMKMRILHRV